MEMFRETALIWLWPLCIALWTVMAAVSLVETCVKHRHSVKALTNRLERLEKAVRKKDKGGGGPDEPW